MFRALNTAATGMVAMQTNVDVIANNMANANTTGFRRSRAEFQDLVYQTFRAPGGQTGPQTANQPTGVQVGLGTRNVSMEHIHMQGALQQTNNPLDLAIEGDGFFQVIRPDGTFAFTRAGNLKVDPQGQVVTVDGYLLEPALVVPPEAQSVNVSPTGIVSAVMAGETTAQEIGRLELANFLNPAGLLAIGRAQYIPTDGSGPPLIAPPGEEGNGTILQGMLEGSNVEVVNEMIDLITSQRAYEVNQRVVQAADEMLRRVTDR
ncbi:MAG TPA: flagellar basal-body rod protein FlgG [Polyangiaceae bacterium LLY-WYZ-14_1]|nr:flagellar basal-body rod protein FlgG [Polyangiaceae bacterium LLY-WYZ-14_1]